MKIGIKYKYKGRIVETVHSLVDTHKIAVKYLGTEDKLCFIVAWYDLTKLKP